MTQTWQERILENFSDACDSYNSEAIIQNIIAKQLATECAKKIIPPGIWMDLGSGTGLLADELERLNKNQSVLRVDGSSMMLNKHSKNCSVKLWNLNSGPPASIEPPTLIASSFAIHWLNDPNARLKEWLEALAPKGWLALAVPIKGSFIEWRKAAAAAKVNCTAMDFPTKDSLIESLPKGHIRYQKIERITQNGPNITSLLKPLVKIGAQTTQHKPLKISEWRNLQRAWPISKITFQHQLTWLVQILLVEK